MENDDIWARFQVAKLMDAECLTFRNALTPGYFRHGDKPVAVRYLGAQMLTINTS